MLDSDKTKDELVAELEVSRRRIADLEARETECRVVEGALRKQADLFMSVAQTTHEGIRILDADQKTTFVNQAFADMLGFSVPEMLKSTADDFLFPGDIADFQQRLARRRAGIGEIYESRFQRMDGSTLWARVSAIPLMDREGRFFGSLAMFTDISMSKKTQEALLESQNRFRLLVENAGDAIYLTDMTGRFLNVNPEAEHQTGFTRQELLNMNIVDLDVQQSPESMAAFAQLILTQRKASIETRHRHKSGATFPVELRVNFLESGDERFLLGIARDVTARTQTEEALKQSELFLRSTLDGLSANIAILDEQGNIVLVNKAWREFARQNGISSKSVSEGTNYLLACDKASGPNSEEASSFAYGIRMVLAGNKDFFVMEYPCDSPDAKRWFAGRVTPFPGSGPRRVVIAHEDITYRKLAEEALSASEERYRTIVQTANEGIWILDQDGATTYINHTMAEMLGSAVDDVIGKHARDFLFPEDHEDFEARCLERSSGVSLRYERRLRKKDGGEAWFIASTTPIIGKDNDPLGSFGMFTEITDRKQTEKALLESEVRHRTILMTAMDGFWLADTQGNLLQVNETYCRMSGYNEQELLAIGIPGLEIAENKKDISAHIQKIMAQGEDRFETRHRRKDGNIIDVEVSVQYRSIAGGQCVSFIRDITELKRAEQFRADVERIIRHDIKSPLSGLHSLAKYALDDPLDEEFRAAVPAILRSINNVINLVDSSEKLIQMERGEYMPHANGFNFNNVVNNIVLSLDTLTKHKFIRILHPGIVNSDAPTDQPVVYGEEFLIKDMLSNLVKNAVEASPMNSDVTVACHLDQDEQRISIHNWGVVPEAIRDHFFDKYVTAGKHYGKGLGTYSAKLIAKAHGGRIEFTTSEVEGTTVTVFLPGSKT